MYTLHHLDIYCLYIQIRIDVKVFSPTLCRPTQQKDGERPRINLGLNGCEHNQNQILGLQKTLFLALLLEL